MERKRILRGLGPILALSTAALLAPTPVVAATSGNAPSTLVVHPNGDPAQDVANVQAAIDTATTVVLSATDVGGVATAFDFGPNTPGGGFVELRRDVTVVGEEVGSARTTVQGGFAPFRGLASDPVSSSIRGIRFSSPGVAALFVTGATGVEFTDNVVTDVVGLPDWVPGISKGQGVWVVGPETVTGRVEITGNVVEGVDAQNGYGFALFGFAAEAVVSENVVSGVNTAGILVGVHSDRVTVSGNRIAPGPQQAPEYGGGNGIIIGNANGGTAIVERNQVDCVNPLADGILVAASTLFGDTQDAAWITRNEVRMHGSFFGAISLLGDVSNTLVTSNRITGSGAVAFDLGAFGPPTTGVTDNTHIGNNIAGFHSLVADAYLGPTTSDNLLIERLDTVIDLGTDNWISGTTTGAPPVPPGERLRERPVDGQSLLRELRAPMLPSP